MILGIGVDTVDLARFAARLTAAPALRQRLFTPRERDLAPQSLAARFAAKEALIKALGGSAVSVPGGADIDLAWHDLEVPRRPGERPRFSRTARLAAVLGALGAADPQLSLTHDGGTATAFVVLETGVKTGRSPRPE